MQTTFLANAIEPKHYWARFVRCSIFGALYYSSALMSMNNSNNGKFYNRKRCCTHFLVNMIQFFMSHFIDLFELLSPVVNDKLRQCAHCLFPSLRTSFPMNMDNNNGWFSEFNSNSINEEDLMWRDPHFSFEYLIKIRIQQI